MQYVCASAFGVYRPAQMVLQPFSVATTFGMRILVGTDDAVEGINSTPINLRKSTLEEYIEAHPGGIASQDKGKNLTFRLK